MSKTDYTFKVRGVFKDVEGPYSPVSDNITTTESVATHLMKFCTVLKKGHPSKYLLPAEENIKSRNEVARTRQLVFGRLLLIIKKNFFCFTETKHNVFLNLDVKKTTTVFCRKASSSIGRKNHFASWCDRLGKKHFS